MQGIDELVHPTTRGNLRVPTARAKATALNYDYHPMAEIQNVRPTGSLFVVTTRRFPAAVVAP